MVRGITILLVIQTLSIIIQIARANNEEHNNIDNVEVTNTVSTSYYTSADDASWAVWDTTINNDILQSDRLGSYIDFMNKCREAAGDQYIRLCDRDEQFRMQMNMYQPRSMNNYTKMGFLKVRAPDAVMELLRTFWNDNHEQLRPEWDEPNSYHNTWDINTRVISIEDTNLAGGGYYLRTKVAEAVRDVIEEWTGMRQAIASVYGIRTYYNGSILAPHVDRLPLVSSSIINVAQDVDEDWPLEVYDHDGVAHNITMKPGDLVLYESHSVIHGRPFAMKGRYYANVFVHFEPLGPLNAADNTEVIHNNIRYPPYLIPNSSWEPEWLDGHPNGWNVLEDAERLVRDGDLKTIRYAAKIHPNIIHGSSEEDCRPIHEAVYQGQVDVVHYLAVDQHVNMTTNCSKYGGTPLDVAHKQWGDDHPITDLLESLKSPRLEDEYSTNIEIIDGSEL